jgi:hypothetical protein
MTGSVLTLLCLFQKAVEEHKVTYSGEYMRHFIDCYIRQIKRQDNTEETFHFSGMSRFPVLSKCHIAVTESEQLRRLEPLYYFTEFLESIDYSLPEQQLRVLRFDFSTTVTATLNFAMAFLINCPEMQIKMQQDLTL